MGIASQSSPYANPNATTFHTPTGLLQYNHHTIKPKLKLTHSPLMPQPRPTTPTTMNHHYTHHYADAAITQTNSPPMTATTFWDQQGTGEHSTPLLVLWSGCTDL